MSTLEEVRRQNQELADRIKEETSKDPHSPYAGKCVGIINGQVVAVDDEVYAVLRRLSELETDAHRVFLVDPNYDPTKVEYIWRY